jgi:hypothetical protein
LHLREKHLNPANSIDKIGLPNNLLVHAILAK